MCDRDRRNPDEETAMRQLIVNTFLTLDGVMQAPGGPEEDPSGGFEHGGWSVAYWDDVMNETMARYMAEPTDLLLGRRTYEIFAAHWPRATAEEREARGGTASDVEDEAAASINQARKYVASTTLTEVTWEGSELLEGDVPTAVAALKAQDGPDLLVHGSSDLIQTLLEHDLVDEFRIWTFPVVVGPGKRLFGDRTFAGGMEVVESAVSTTGVVMARYRRAGAVPTGSFAFEVPDEAEAARRAKLAAE
jgi:dihydrofolate reductase